MTHESPYLYVRGCRCDLCRASWALYKKNLRARHKSGDIIHKGTQDRMMRESHALGLALEARKATTRTSSPIRTDSLELLDMAILQLTIVDLKSSIPQIRNPAVLWFNDDATYLFSATAVCERVGLSIDFVRRRLKSNMPVDTTEILV